MTEPLYRVTWKITAGLLSGLTYSQITPVKLKVGREADGTVILAVEALC
jgi:hypothetical protein